VLLASGGHPRATEIASLAGAKRVPAVSMPPEHPTLITHTSGTTGIPKLAVHTGATFEARYRPQGTVASVVSKRDSVAIHVSFVHSRMFTAMPISILQGHSVIILAEDDPKMVGDLFATAPPGLIEAHPNTFMRWEELVDDPRQPLANVKYFSSTFDAIHPRTVRSLLSASRRKGALFIQMHGQSEVGPIAGRAYKKDGMQNGRCVGMPFPGMTGVRVVSRDGKPPTKETPGYIEVRSDGRIITYLGERERYEKQVNDGWWRMGDLGYRTKWGCLHLLDREVDQIRQAVRAPARADRGDHRPGPEQLPRAGGLHPRRQRAGPDGVGRRRGRPAADVGPRPVAADGPAADRDHEDQAARTGQAAGGQVSNPAPPALGRGRPHFGDENPAENFQNGVPA
jgi:acyl-coenzyme A synthetase/AMP-(fatty) acid ligase